MSDHKQDEYLERKAEEHREYLKEYDKSKLLVDLIDEGYSSSPYLRSVIPISLKEIFTVAFTELIEDIYKDKDLMLEFAQLIENRLADDKKSSMYDDLTSGLRELCYDYSLLIPEE